MKKALVVINGTFVNHDIITSAVHVAKLSPTPLYAFFLTHANKSPEFDYLFPNDLSLNQNNITGKTIAEENGYRIETFVPKVKFDASYNDSAYYYYSNELKNIDFSFSDELDRSRNSKLVFIKIVYSPNPKSQELFEKTGKTFTFKIEKFNTENPANLNTIFERFKREQNK